ncbi:hypothetical protein LR48_Vigan54s000300 [Vigna angularis]|uniref:Uncharacterized protein n=1 Tax=Phaseolus angularis TaxID=3914 RepID=A0A0L9T4C0_PHAAN|nr:hypothetical protein LR48_Vigan54s000300 [Vigna angularis]
MGEGEPCYNASSFTLIQRSPKALLFKPSDPLKLRSASSLARIALRSRLQLHRSGSSLIKWREHKLHDLGHHQQLLKLSFSCAIWNQALEVFILFLQMNFSSIANENEFLDPYGSNRSNAKTTQLLCICNPIFRAFLQ